MESVGSIALARREPRATVILLIVILLGWVFLVWAVTDMTNPLAQLMMPMDSNWTMGNIVAVFVMWAAMMMAMMLPAAAPMVLTFVNLCRHKQQSGLAWVFVTAYLVIWTLFSAAATVLHWGLQVSGMITPMMASSSIWLTGILLVVAGSGTVHAAERSLFATLPHTDGILANRMARWGDWRLAHGFQTRAFLSGLLLGADGSTFCSRGHEPRLGSGTDSSSGHREDSPGRSKNR